MLQEVRKRLGSGSKDVITMLRILSLDVVAPEHVQSFLEALGGLDGVLCPCSYC
jgi:hypothetical protein